MAPVMTYPATERVMRLEGELLHALASKSPNWQQLHALLMQAQQDARLELEHVLRDASGGESGIPDCRTTGAYSEHA